MLKIFSTKKLRRICSRLGLPVRRRSRSRPKIVVKKLGKSSSSGTNWRDATATTLNNANGLSSSSVIHPSNDRKPIRVATFNAALFSMAPAVPQDNSSFGFENDGVINSDNNWLRVTKPVNDPRPKGILKQSPLRPSAADDNSSAKPRKFVRSRLRVSINLPDNEISLKRGGQLSFAGDNDKQKEPLRSSSMRCMVEMNGKKTVVEVLRELDVDVLDLQDVKAEEENSMRPLSDLAAALGMNYVFGESWAPEYGNAILSRWPIKRWKAHKIFDDTDIRNVLKATIDVPQAGEINFFCTLLDHLDESWRMKQINAIIQSTGVPHILAGGLNSLDETDYSQERWTDIVKYYEEMGKPTPKVEVMKYLKSKQYTDVKDFAGECESVVVIAKGQSVQGTCKYGTRVDYLLSSPNAPYEFVPGSYSVMSSKGTSDHHIVKVDMIKVANTSPQEWANKKTRRTQSVKTVAIDHSTPPSKGIWKLHSLDNIGKQPLYTQDTGSFSSVCIS